jgi:hypothetical protein
MKVTLTEPGVAGDYVVVERHPDRSALVAPETSVAAIRRRLGVEPARRDELERHSGHLPSEGEG